MRLPSLRISSGPAEPPGDDLYWLARTEPLPVRGPLGMVRHASLDVAIPSGLLRQHLFVTGATGSGKSLRVIFPVLHQHIVRGRGALVVTFKHDPPLFRRLHGVLRAVGREGDLLYLSLRPEDAGATCWWHPLSAVESVAVVADALVAAVVEDAPEIRYYAAQNVDGLSIVLEAARRHGEELSFPRVADLLSESGMQGPGAALLSYLRPFHDLSKRARTVRWEHAADLKMMAARLAGFAAFCPAPGRHRLDLLDAVRRGLVVVASLDSMSTPQAARYAGRMVINLLGAVLSGLGRTEQDPLFLVVLDEFGAVAGPHLQNLLAKARGFGVGLVLATQSLGDLRSAGSRERAGGLLAQITENVATQVVLTMRDPDDARWWSEASGSMLRRYAFESILEHGAAMEGLGKVHSASRESARVHQNKLLYLPAGLGYIWLPSRRRCLWWPGGRRPAFPRDHDVRDAVLCAFGFPPDPGPEAELELAGGRVAGASEGVPPAPEEVPAALMPVPEPESAEPAAGSAISGLIGGELQQSPGTLRKTRRGKRGGRRVRERERLAEMAEMLEGLPVPSGPVED